MSDGSGATVADGGVSPGQGSLVAVAVGSNLGDRRGHLGSALVTMEERWGLRAISSVYESSAVGTRYAAGPDPESPFLNLCVVLGQSPEPHVLLDALLEMEAAAGRPRRGRMRRGDRTLDLDLLLYGDRRISSTELTVPHPRMSGRAFVLVPLSEIAASWRVPGTGARVAELARRVDQDKLVRVGSGAELLKGERSDLVRTGGAP